MRGTHADTDSYYIGLVQRIAERVSGATMPSVWKHTALSCVRSLWLAEMLSAESVAIRSQAGTLSLHLTNCSFGKRQRALNPAPALSCCLHVDRARIHIFIRMDGKVVVLGRPLILSCDQTLWRRFSTFATRPQR